MPVRRAAAAAAPPAAVGVNFFDDEFYAGGGFNLPEGNYALLFDVRNHAYTKKNGTLGIPNLGVFVTAYPLIEGADNTIDFGDPLEQFYSMGGKAKLSFAPNPDTGKGIVAIPGAPSTTLPRLTNWDTLRKSLLDSGLPKGLISNDFTPLDGIWVHIQTVKAPEERKTFGVKTGEAEDEVRNDTISVVSEILADGRPWEGTGGLPEDAAPAAPAPVAAPVRRTGPARAAAPAAPAPRAAAPRTAAAPRGRVAAPPADADVEQTDAEAVLDAALNAASAVLTRAENAKGMKKILLRTEAFKAVGDDPDMQQAVMESHFTDETLPELLATLNYKIAGVQVVPA